MSRHIAVQPGASHRSGDLMAESTVVAHSSRARSVVAWHHLTCVAADGGAAERAEAFASAHVHSAVLYGPPQQNVIR